VVRQHLPVLFTHRLFFLFFWESWTLIDFEWNYLVKCIWFIHLFSIQIKWNVRYIHSNAHNVIMETRLAVIRSSSLDLFGWALSFWIQVNHKNAQALVFAQIVCMSSKATLWSVLPVMRLLYSHTPSYHTFYVCVFAAFIVVLMHPRDHLTSQWSFYVSHLCVLCDV